MGELLRINYFLGIPLSLVTLPGVHSSFDSSLQQGKDTTAVVVTQPFQPLLLDENEEPIVGATIVNQRTSASALSDANGTVKLIARKGDVVRVVAFGSVLREYVVGDTQSPVILLSSKQRSIIRLKPVRMLNYTAIRPDLTTASTQAVYNSDLKKYLFPPS